MAYNLSQITKCVKDIAGFLEGGDLAEALEAIGNHELDAAAYIIKNLGKFNDKSDAVNRAIGHLESAVRHFWGMTNKYNKISGNLQKNIVFGSNKAYWTCCLTAICHSYLRDDRKIIKDYL